VARQRSKGWVVSKLTDPTGIMDHVFWVPGGKPWLVEFKDPKGHTALGRAKLQAYYREKLSADGYATSVITTRQEFLDTLAWISVV